MIPYKNGKLLKKLFSKRVNKIHPECQENKKYIKKCPTKDKNLSKIKIRTSNK